MRSDFKHVFTRDCGPASLFRELRAEWWRCGHDPRRKKTPVRDVPCTRLQSDSELTRLYMYESKLGKGNYGVVYRARHIETQTLWASRRSANTSQDIRAGNLLDNENRDSSEGGPPNIHPRLREVLNTSSGVIAHDQSDTERLLQPAQTLGGLASTPFPFTLGRAGSLVGTFCCTAASSRAHSLLALLVLVHQPQI
ncbi:hypothetical protein WMY93_022362 [Mugilogobius chulae]|uniref:Protein kinase domain-containing protein n=1 Tax=Mugilogobius chulae TaxID=88201 RepID=A0AAW0NBP2_9GOBI